MIESLGVTICMTSFSVMLKPCVVNWHVSTTISRDASLRESNEASQVNQDLTHTGPWRSGYQGGQSKFWQPYFNSIATFKTPDMEKLMRNDCLRPGYKKSYPVAKR